MLYFHSGALFTMRISNLIALASLLALTPACGDVGAIAPDELTYKVQATYGYFDGFAFLVKDQRKSRCIRLVVSSDEKDIIVPSVATEIQTPEGLVLKQMVITDDLADCVTAVGDDTSPPEGEAEQAASGVGRIELSSPDDVPRTASLHVTLRFTADDVIPEQSITLDADGVEVH